MTISEFRTDNGIATDELFAPGYVRFDCGVWHLPDNTMALTGWHVVYRPLAVGIGYQGHELVTPEMRAAVRVHYRAQRAAEAAEQAKRDAAIAAEEERFQANNTKAEKAFDDLYNEGHRDGYNPYRL